MKICFVTDNVNPKAGLGRMVHNITGLLKERGHEIGFVLAEGKAGKKSLAVGFRFSWRRILSTFVDILRMRSFLKEYDAVVSFDVQPAGMLVYLATLGRRDVCVIHALGTYGLFTPDNWIKNKLISFAYKKASRVFLINDFVRKKIEESNPEFLFSQNVSLVPVGVNTKRFIKKTNQQAGATSKEYVISFGALKPRKGQLESLKAFSSIASSYPNLNYVFVGSTSDAPSYYNRIVQYVKECDLTNRVSFVENVNDDQLVSLYSQAKFFVLTPSSSKTSIEGFGMVYLESALCGLTAIGTKDTGAEVAIIDNKTGLLVDQDVTKIAEAMIVLIEDDALRERYAKSAYERALTFDWSSVVDLYESELTKLTS